MKNRRTLWIATAAMAMLGLAVQITSARIDVKVDFDKNFDFKSVRTWTWSSPLPGDVKMARTKDDDPEAMRRLAEPIILDAMNVETKRRGLQPASGEPDVVITYYLLMTTTMSAQTMGQFLPAVSGWGLPPFEGATQSLKIMNRGSLVLDMSARDQVIWRGVAQANLKMDADIPKREKTLREAVRDLLARFPPRR
jgi:hypothetical protein